MPGSAAGTLAHLSKIIMYSVCFENLKLKLYTYQLKSLNWMINLENNIKIENAILNKAKKLKLQSS